MFGWEFPPHIAGGLGTACYGMTRGLARNDVDVTFVMPRASGDEDERFIRVVNASDVETVFGKVSSDAADIIDKMSFIHIDSNLVPYLSPEDYETYHDEFVKTGEKRWETSDIWSQRYTFSGKYGANLMEEVARYAIVAAQVAKDLEGQFDVIHAHDWLTYFAGIAAKRVSGKPLVVHMHATSFDRSSSDNIDTRVYEIERAGMAAADRVIAVSNLTRNIVIEKYNIPAEKVVTVHNAVRFAENENEVPERGVTGGGMFWEWQPIEKANPHKPGDFRSACINFPTVIAACLLHTIVPEGRTAPTAERPTMQTKEFAPCPTP